MDSVIIEKLEAIKKRYKNQTPLLQKFSHFLISLLSLGLFLSSPLWLRPSLSMLKEVGVIAFGPKGLFVVCNIIIAVLFGESRLCKPSVQTDIYEEYGNRNRSNQKLEQEYEVQRRRRRRRELQVEEDEEEEEEEKIGEKGLDELNKRVEDFIAKVNRQRKLEAKLIDCYG